MPDDSPADPNCKHCPNDPQPASTFNSTTPGVESPVPTVDPSSSPGTSTDFAQPTSTVPSPTQPSSTLVPSSSPVSPSSPASPPSPVFTTSPVSTTSPASTSSSVSTVTFGADPSTSVTQTLGSNSAINTSIASNVSKGPNVGAIVGGVMGALALILLAALALAFIRRRRRRYRIAPSSEYLASQYPFQPTPVVQHFTDHDDSSISTRERPYAHTPTFPGVEPDS